MKPAATITVGMTKGINVNALINDLREKHSAPSRKAGNAATIVSTVETAACQK